MNSSLPIKQSIRRTHEKENAEEKSEFRLDPQKSDEEKCNSLEMMIERKRDASPSSYFSSSFSFPILVYI